MFTKLFGGLAARKESTAKSGPAQLVDGYLKDVKDLTAWGPGDIKLETLPHGSVIHAASPTEQVAIVLAVIDRMLGLGRGNGAVWQELAKLSWLVTKLMRKRLPVAEAELATMLDAVVRSGGNYLWQWPLGTLLGTTERFVEANGLSDRLGFALERVVRTLDDSGYGDVKKHSVRAAKILAGSDGGVGLVPSDWGKTTSAWLESLDADSRQSWSAVLEHAGAGGGKTAPSAKWLAAAGPVVEAVGAEPFRERLEAWLDGFELDPNRPEPNADTVKGLIWIAGNIGDDAIAPALGRFCERCFRKIPGIGPASMKLGNACLLALATMSGDRAIAQLVRLRGRIKQAQPKQRIESALGEAASHAGLTVGDLEEIALPTFGLDADGARKVALGDVTAEIRIAGSVEVTLSWTGADGKPRKSVPASVKTDHADALKALRAEIKEIKGLLAGQRFRLESLYLAQRSWPLSDWRKRYLEHPLMAKLARRLIWNFGDIAAVPLADGYVGIGGKPFEPPADATVSLWHPIGAEAKSVLEWRRRLAALDIVQPFKQAHREVYLLTDAERATGVYSNRFAAHILRQHQMKALCDARGWRYVLQGAWDQEESVPTLHLPNWRMSVEFWVDHASDDYLDSGIYIYRATDQVRFLDEAGAAMRLERVPPMVLSEAMRDVDLFVGVASVGNDPEWLDRGPDVPFRQYWRDFSFGDLGESARTRKEVLEDLLPKLKIGDRCEISGRFLKVRGTKRTYKIHLGSGNILMEPNDQYLCIVQGRGKTDDVRSDRVRLPFEGDGVLSVILSKAFLLAEDDKITDRTILSQIGG